MHATPRDAQPDHRQADPADRRGWGPEPWGGGETHQGFWRRGFSEGAGYSIPGLCFLGVPIWFARDAPLPILVALCALLLVIGVLAIGWAWVVHWPLRWRCLWVAALTLAIVAAAVVTQQPALVAYYSIYITVSTAMLVPWRWSRWVIVSTATTAVMPALFSSDPFAALMTIMALAFGLMIAVAREASHKEQRVRAAEQRTAVLAVAAERERIGRDLHDILGHSLTTIAVKADLTSRLIARDDDAALSEVRALGEIARQALSDVRATASGMREVRLASEVASARSVLLAAGVEARTPPALPALPEDRSELFGYVVREAITNVVRHARASVCTITCDDTSVSIADDGVGLSCTQGGNGLTGLRERVEQAGGTLLVDSSDRGTHITARMEPA